VRVTTIDNTVAVADMKKPLGNMVGSSWEEVVGIIVVAVVVVDKFGIGVAEAVELAPEKSPCSLIPDIKYSKTRILSCLRMQNHPVQCPSCHLILNQLLLKDSALIQYQNVATVKDNLIMTQRELIYNLMRFVGCDIKGNSNIYSTAESFARKEVDFVKSVNRMVGGTGWQG
ncbi:9272_t:CDS:1, partial [Acaulospora colombiana]